jgi:hypothetical protein
VSLVVWFPSPNIFWIWRPKPYFYSVCVDH